MENRAVFFSKPTTTPLLMLPPEILADILLRLDPSILIATISLVNHALRNFATSNLIFKKKLQQHFHVTTKKKHRKAHYERFCSEYKSQYSFFSPERKRWFTLIKEGDLSTLKNSDLPISPLLPVLSKYDDKSIFNWIRPNQKMRDYLFQRVFSYSKNWYKQLFLPYDKWKVNNRTIPHYIGTLGPSQALVNKLMPNLNVAKVKFDAHGFSPFLHAVIRGLDDTCNLLLHHGAPINTGTAYRSSLCFTVSEGDLRGTKSLLALGANQGLFDRAIYHAVENNHAHLIKTLCKHGALINISLPHVYDNLSPLQLAVKKGYEKSVKALLEESAHPNYTNNNETPLYLAAKKGNFFIARLLLLAGAQPDLISEDGLSALHIASQNGHHDVIQILIGSKTNINLTTLMGETALHLAAQNNQSIIVKMLLSAGASPLIPDIDGDTPLIAAAIWNSLGAIKALWKVTHINHQNHNGATALYEASCAGNEKIVHYLLKKGANPFIQNNDGCTALHTACEENHFDVVQTLLRFCEQLLYITNKENQTPADMLECVQKPDINQSSDSNSERNARDWDDSDSWDPDQAMRMTILNYLKEKSESCSTASSRLTSI